MRTQFQLTPRQGWVAARLYEEFGWSATRIARASGAGRRAVENALHRAGVRPRRRARDARAELQISEAEAVAWFAEAGRPERAEVESTHVPPTADVVLPDGEVVTTYDRRRCAGCGRLNAHAVVCAGCGVRLDAARPDVDPIIASIIEKETSR